jgi:hypothetical protein
MVFRSITLWDEVVPLLEDTFDLIIPDLRGFGESSTVDSFYSLEDYAADLAALTVSASTGCHCRAFHGRLHRAGTNSSHACVDWGWSRHRQWQIQRRKQDSKSAAGGGT